MANETQVNISISTPQELIDFFSETIETNTDYNVTIENDIDMIDYGVITEQSIKSAANSKQSNIIVDLNGHTIKNIYPIFISWIVVNGYCLTVKNGYIENVLINSGSIIDIKNQIGSTTTTAFKTIFSGINASNGAYNSRYSVVFDNIGFSLLGCNFYDTGLMCASVVYFNHPSSSYSFLPAFLFKSCSFYIRAYNLEPMTNDAIFMNCSFYYDIEYKKIDFYNQTSSNYYHRNNMYVFCTFNGKMKKSPDYVDVTGYETIIGYMYNSYFNVETDIEKPLYIACQVDQAPYTYYRQFHIDSYNTDTTDYVFDTTTVYNAEKYLPEIVDGKNCCPVLGATALTDAEMHNTEKLLEIGLLAVDAEGETA